VDTYNIRVLELTPEDLQRAATNGGLNVPLSPETRLVNIKGSVQTKPPAEKVPKSDDPYPPLGGLPVAG
jgi:hypothetical protein